MCLNIISPLKHGGIFGNIGGCVKIWGNFGEILGNIPIYMGDIFREYKGGIFKYGEYRFCMRNQYPHIEFQDGGIFGQLDQKAPPNFPQLGFLCAVGWDRRGGTVPDSLHHPNGRTGWGWVGVGWVSVVCRWVCRWRVGGCAVKKVTAPLKS